MSREIRLMVLDHPHVGTVVEEHCLLQLDRHGEAATLLRLQAQTVGKSFESYFTKDTKRALPIDAAAQVQAIRPDLILGPLMRMEQVLKAADAGHVIWPLRAPHVLISFFTLDANLGTACAVTPVPLLLRAAGQKVLALMQALADGVDPASHDMDPIAALDALSERTGSRARP